MNKRVSLIIPVYNGVKFLPRLFETLSNITYSNTEIVFVDNNSTDDSYVELNKLANRLKQFDVIVEKESASGAGLARNKGVNICTGEYISFLDCDDYFEPQKIEKDLAILTNEAIDFVFSRGFRKYEDGRTLLHPREGIKDGINEPPALGLLWLKNFFSLQHFAGTLFSKRLFDEIGGFPDTKTGEDAILMIKLGLTKRGYFNNEVLYTYFRHSESTVSEAAKQGNREIDYYKHRLLMWNDSLITSINEAKKMLAYQINIDILKHNEDHKREMYELAQASNFKPNLLINNPLSFFIQKKAGFFKNPFFWLHKLVFN